MCGALISFRGGDKVPKTDFSSAIGQLKGRVLSSIEFVQDYVQLRFDGPCLTMYTHPNIDHTEGRSCWGSTGYRDRLCDQIGSTVTDAWANEAEVSVGFESGTVISVSMKDEDYSGPEAVQFVGEDGSLWVG